MIKRQVFKFSELLKIINIKEAFVSDYLSHVIMISIQTFFLFLKEDREKRNLNAERLPGESRQRTAQ